MSGGAVDVDWFYKALMNVNLHDLDKDGSDAIELDEFKKYFADLDQKVDEKLIEQIFALIDDNNSKEIHILEYFKWRSNFKKSDLQQILPAAATATVSNSTPNTNSNNANVSGNQYQSVTLQRSDSASSDSDSDSDSESKSDIGDSESSDVSLSLEDEQTQPVPGVPNANTNDTSAAKNTPGGPSWMYAAILNINLDVLDEDDTNSIDLPELKEYFAGLEHTMPEELVEQIYHQIDKRQKGEFSTMQYLMWRSGFTKEDLDQMLSKITPSTTTITTNAAESSVKQPDTRAIHTTTTITTTMASTDPDTGLTAGTKKPNSLSRTKSSDYSFEWLYDVLVNVNLTMIDDDNSNTIELSELVEYFEQFEYQIPLNVIQKVYQRLDTANRGHFKSFEYFGWRDSFERAHLQQLLDDLEFESLTLPSANNNNNSMEPPSTDLKQTQSMVKATALERNVSQFLLQSLTEREPNPEAKVDILEENNTNTDNNGTNIVIKTFTNDGQSSNTTTTYTTTTTNTNTNTSTTSNMNTNISNMSVSELQNAINNKDSEIRVLKERNLQMKIELNQKEKLISEKESVILKLKRQLQTLDETMHDSKRLELQGLLDALQRTHTELRDSYDILDESNEETVRKLNEITHQNEDLRVTIKRLQNTHQNMLGNAGDYEMKTEVLGDGRHVSTKTLTQSMHIHHKSQVQIQTIHDQEYEAQIKALEQQLLIKKQESTEILLRQNNEISALQRRLSQEQMDKLQIEHDAEIKINKLQSIINQLRLEIETKNETMNIALRAKQQSSANEYLLKQKVSHIYSILCKELKIASPNQLSPQTLRPYLNNWRQRDAQRYQKIIAVKEKTIAQITKQHKRETTKRKQSQKKSQRLQQQQQQLKLQIQMQLQQQQQAPAPAQPLYVQQTPDQKKKKKKKKKRKTKRTDDDVNNDEDTKDDDDEDESLQTEDEDEDEDDAEDPEDEDSTEEEEDEEELPNEDEIIAEAEAETPGEIELYDYEYDQNYQLLPDTRVRYTYATDPAPRKQRRKKKVTRGGMTETAGTNAYAFLSAFVKDF